MAGSGGLTAGPAVIGFADLGTATAGAHAASSYHTDCSSLGFVAVDKASAATKSLLEQRTTGFRSLIVHHSRAAKIAAMRNLYSLTRNREAILRLFRASDNRAPSIDPQPAIFPRRIQRPTSQWQCCSRSLAFCSRAAATMVLTMAAALPR